MPSAIEPVVVHDDDQRDGDGAEQRADRDVDLAGNEDDGEPMPAISASEAWPSTLVMLRVEKKFSASEREEGDEEEQAEQQRQLLLASRTAATRA